MTAARNSWRRLLERPESPGGRGAHVGFRLFLVGKEFGADVSESFDVCPGAMMGVLARGSALPLSCALSTSDTAEHGRAYRSSADGRSSWLAGAFYRGRHFSTSFCHAFAPFEAFRTRLCRRSALHTITDGLARWQFLRAPRSLNVPIQTVL